MRRFYGFIGSSAVTAVMLAGIPGCDFSALFRQTASLGGDVAGGEAVGEARGNAQVVFINNTPFRAIFTFGAYDDLDRLTRPVLVQFSADTGTEELAGNSQTDLLQIRCARVFSIGGKGLITRTHTSLPPDTYEESALVEGVFFSSAPDGDELANAPTEGTAPPIDVYIGEDFECGSLVIFRLEFDDAGPAEFVVEQTVIRSESTRG